MEKDFTQKIELIKNKVNIVDIIGHYLKLTKKGNNYWSICPFHEDSNPSMSISQEKQIYKCFSCGAHGNVFIFLQKYKNIDFFNSLKEIAEIANIDLKSLNINLIDKKAENKHPYKILNDLATNFFQYQLSTELGSEAINYLTSRNISSESIDFFKIGFAPKNNELLNYLLMQGYKEKEIIATGLAKINDENQIKDLFANRIIFPIYDLENNCLGFSGRKYLSTGTSTFKYVNTPETEIFKKSKLLYNLNNAQKVLSNKDSLYLVEGYMDVIALNSQNIKNCVAIMGTSLAKEQIFILKKMTNNIKIFLDGDGPGKIATYKIATKLIENNFNVKIIDNKSLLDPDELINKNINLFQEIIKKEIHPVEFAINFFSSQYDLTKDSYQIKEFLTSLKPIWNIIKDPVDLIFYSNKLEKITNLTKDEINKLLQNEPKIQNKIVESKKYQRLTINQKIIYLQKELIYLLLISRSVYDFLENKKFIFCNYKLMNLYFLINHKYNEDKNLQNIDLSNLIFELKNNNEILLFLQEIIEENQKKNIETTEIILQDYLRINNNYSIEVKINLLKKEVLTENDINNKIKILQEISNLKKQIKH